jgi:hypothetical protein
LQLIAVRTRKLEHAQIYLDSLVRDMESLTKDAGMVDSLPHKRKGASE